MSAVAQFQLWAREIALIKNEVSKFYGFTVAEIESRARPRRLAWARMTGMYLARALTGAPLQVVADSFRKLDHTSALYAESAVKARIDTELSFRVEVREVARRSARSIAAAVATPSSQETLRRVLFDNVLETPKALSV